MVDKNSGDNGPEDPMSADDFKAYADLHAGAQRRPGGQYKDLEGAAYPNRLEADESEENSPQAKPEESGKTGDKPLSAPDDRNNSPSPPVEPEGERTVNGRRVDAQGRPIQDDAAPAQDETPAGRRRHNCKSPYADHFFGFEHASLLDDTPSGVLRKLLGDKALHVFLPPGSDGSDRGGLHVADKKVIFHGAAANNPEMIIAALLHFKDRGRTRLTIPKDANPMFQALVIAGADVLGGIKIKHEFPKNDMSHISAQARGIITAYLNRANNPQQSAAPERQIGSPQAPDEVEQTGHNSLFDKPSSAKSAAQAGETDAAAEGRQAPGSAGESAQPKVRKLFGVSRPRA